MSLKNAENMKLDISDVIGGAESKQEDAKSLGTAAY